MALRYFKKEDYDNKGNFGIATLPGPTNEWAECAEAEKNHGTCFTGVCPLTGKKLNCVKCTPDNRTECGQQLNASGWGDCIPDAYLNKCCVERQQQRKNSGRSMRDTNPITEKSKGMNIIWKYFWPVMIGVFLLWLIVWYWTRPKKSKSTVYWRR